MSNIGGNCLKTPKTVPDLEPLPHLEIKIDLDCPKLERLLGRHWLSRLKELTCHAALKGVDISVFLHPPAITCSDLEDPAYGTVSVKGLHVGSVAMYGCNEGFELEGAVTRICQITGQWSPPAPLCKRE